MFDSAVMIGQTLDSKYRLEEQLGQGGMGAVYRATHLGTDRVVALKLIAPGLMDQEDFVARFQREARATGRLRHPNIVDLTDFGFTERDGRGHAYLVMEYLVGCPLADVLRDEKHLPTPWIVDILGQVCAGLQKAHDQGIVHRDLKPDNIWLEPNDRGGFTAKILDFGLAKIYDPKARAEGLPGLPMGGLETVALPGRRPAAGAPAATEALSRREPVLTQVGSLLGTPAYMSPEQCRGTATDHRSDLYSLGVMAYQMFAGATPFDGNSLELINSHIVSRVRPLQELRPDLHPGLVQVVMEALAKDPQDRPASAEVFAGALEAYAEPAFGLWRKAVEFYLSRPAALTWMAFKAARPALAVTVAYGLWALFGPFRSAPGWAGTGAAVLVGLWSATLFTGGRLEGQVPVLALNWLAEPLGSRLPEAGPDLRAWSRLRLLRVAGVLGPFALIVGGLGLYDVSQGDGQQGFVVSWLMVASLGLVTLGILVLWTLLRRLKSAQGAGYLVPYILAFEHLSYTEAKDRARVLAADPRARLKRTGLSLPQALLAVLAMDLVAAPAWLLLAALGPSTPAGPLAAFGYELVLGCAVMVFFAPIISAHYAFEYVNIRRMCREPLRAELAAFRREAVGAAQWSRRIQESLRSGT